MFKKPNIKKMKAECYAFNASNPVGSRVMVQLDGRKPPYVRPASDYPEIGLDYLHARCVASEGCLLWTLAMKNGPIAHIQGRAWKVRHLVYRLVHPRGPGKGQLPLPTVCGNARCVHPDHLTLAGRNSHVVGAQRSPVHCMNIARARRAGSAKLTAEQAREIRASNEPLAVLIARYGISQSVASRVRSGQAWKDYTNPFSQLMRNPA